MSSRRPANIFTTSMVYVVRGRLAAQYVPPAHHGGVCMRVFFGFFRRTPDTALLENSNRSKPRPVHRGGSARAAAVCTSPGLSPMTESMEKNKRDT